MTRRWLWPALILLACVSLALSVFIGSASIPVTRVIAALAGNGDPVERAILIELRLPRAILAFAVGAVLGLAGASLQGYLRNPLAEPATLGASNGAALGAVVALYFGLADQHPIVLPLLAIAGAFVALALLFALAGRGESALTLILAGIAISTLAGAAISLALNLASNPFAGMEIMTWLMGSFEDRSFLHVALALPFIAVGMLVLGWDARALDALSLGEDTATTLGIDLRRVRVRLLLGLAFGVGGAVAVSGSVGFVGLIVPHLIRPVTDRNPSSILWPSALAGGVLLSLADVAVRLVPTSNELRIGVVTAFLGVPVFIVHLMRERRLW